jgi:ribosome-associated toxin RatA of RatAB toxin-antitoxin module
MGVVTSEIEIAAEPLKVFRLAREVERYPAYMPNIKTVKVLERRDDGYSRVAWIAGIQVASIKRDVKWTEEEWWDEKSLTSRYQLVEGDYTHYGGDWSFTPAGNRTRVRLTADYDLGLPLVGALISKLLDNIMRDNLNGMLKAIKDRAESGA